MSVSPTRRWNPAPTRTRPRLLRQSHGFEGFIGGSHKEAPAGVPMAGASGCCRQGFRSGLVLALEGTDALALVLELRESLPAVVLALVLAGRRERGREWALRQRGRRPGDGHVRARCALVVEVP